MENGKEIYTRSESASSSNTTSHYRLMTIGIIIGLVGIMLRFASTWEFINILSNIIFVIGIFFSVKAVLNILK